MTTPATPTPRSYHGVMVSSTFKDLEQHRAVLMEALRKQELFAIGMEDYVAVPGDDEISSSINMVRKGIAYIGLISHRCGQVIECATRNPHSYSVTRLEFEEAQRLGLPSLIFVMSSEHAVKPAHFDRDATAISKLEEFRTAAKSGRIYIPFDSLEDFKTKAIHAVASLGRFIEERATIADKEAKKAKATSGTRSPKRAKKVPPSDQSTIPSPPDFYAEPRYGGSHPFVGRAAQLQELSDWAAPADPTNLLLFEAIGGNGKSMLTWEWTEHHAEKVRKWAGRFWYSFYERGAIMADFCQRALAYMTGQPLKKFEKKKTAELAKELLAHLHARPWLLILDGLERVLVAYHRIDAAEVPDEEANQPIDKIVNRNPCDAIRDEDNDLLRALAAAKPSKILVSSRLTPRILLNAAGQPIPGAKRIDLPGLRPHDAEALLRSCGVKGDSAAIQNYLTANCDNHPLVIGILGGLITNYRMDRGNFDAWAAAPDAGAKLNLASLDLIQRRNHILRAALADLPPSSAQLLSTLALLSESVDYATLNAFNPHLPPELKIVGKPDPPEEHWRWQQMTDEQKDERRTHYEAAFARWQKYEPAMQAWRASEEYREALRKLEEVVNDLERRGLLQYEIHTRRYDLHPVVRGVAAGGMQADEKERYGWRVMDHFSLQPHSPYEEAEKLEDLHAGMLVIRTLLKLGDFELAAKILTSNLVDSLLFNVEAYAEILSLLQPFFLKGWGELPEVDDSEAWQLANVAAIALYYCGELRDALAANGTHLRITLETDVLRAQSSLNTFSICLRDQNLLAKASSVNRLALDFASVCGDQEDLFLGQRNRFCLQILIGRWTEAEATWQSLDSMGRDWPRGSYRSGNAEWHYAQFQFWKGTLQDEHLTTAEQLAAEGKNRTDIRSLHRLRGIWRLEQNDWASAAVSFHEAVRMAHESEISDAESQTGLALAKLHLGQLADPHQEVERLAQLRRPAHRLLARLCLAIDDVEQAKPLALAAYRWAWADGEPYVRRYELTKTIELLHELNVPIPDLPPYDPAKDEKFPWEDDVVAAIERLRREKEKREGEKDGEESPENPP